MTRENFGQYDFSISALAMAAGNERANIGDVRFHSICLHIRAERLRTFPVRFKSHRKCFSEIAFR